MRDVAQEVFLSYSRADRAYVERLAKFLQSAGIDCWYDHEVMRGQRFDQVISAKIEECVVFVVVMTPAADESHWVANEIQHARNNNKPIIPILLDGLPMVSVAALDNEDVRTGQMPSRQFVDRVRALLRAVRPTPEPTPEPVVEEPPATGDHGVAPPDWNLAFSGERWDELDEDQLIAFSAIGLLGLLGLLVGAYPVLQWSAAASWVFFISAGLGCALPLIALARLFLVGSSSRLPIVAIAGGGLALISGLLCLIASGVHLWRIFAEHHGVGWLAPTLGFVAAGVFFFAIGGMAGYLDGTDSADLWTSPTDAVFSVVKVHMRRSSWFGRATPPRWVRPLLGHGVRGFSMRRPRFRFALAAGWNLVLIDDSGSPEDSEAETAVKRWSSFADDLFVRVRPHFFAVMPAGTVGLPRHAEVAESSVILVSEADLEELCTPIITRAKPKLWLPLLASMIGEAED
jgi:hypothetical protein